MKEKTVFAGFGGQGIVSLGQIWVYCGMKEGKEVSFFPFYGAEKRGGIARANCIVSEDGVSSPIITTADSAVVMNEDSLALGESILRPDGLLLVNSSLVNATPSRTDIRVKRIPATGIAEKIGSGKIANMVMLGALARLTGALSLDSVAEILRGFFPAAKQRLVPMNVEAIQAGLSFSF
ncbi:MAG TPA: 2-oxoacid:acceptor oxidoreductase family protein [Treponemataceae bacterium]|jgi:2-oxoglutarate ferredoxin oxidoreductase subunit gamma|nr:2-oxoacid:acceptor oxidoreductase family protein [Treponemataceae bacterium]